METPDKERLFREFIMSSFAIYWLGAQSNSATEACRVSEELQQRLERREQEVPDETRGCPKFPFMALH
jgi:hypothetical protein